MVVFKAVNLDSKYNNFKFINYLVNKVVYDLNKLLAASACMDHPEQDLEIEVSLADIDQSYHLRLSSRCCHNFIEDLKIELKEILKIDFTSETIES